MLARARLLRRARPQPQPRRQLGGLIVYADGAARGNPGPAGAGAVAYDARSGAEVARGVRFLDGPQTNNVAEYESLLLALEVARRVGAAPATQLRLDSRLVVEQMAGAFRVRAPTLVALRRRAVEAVRALADAKVSVLHVPRASNAVADQLANLAVDEGCQFVRVAPSGEPPLSQLEGSELGVEGGRLVSV